MTGHWRIAQLLSQQPYRIRELASSTGYSPRTVKDMLASLRRDGLVQWEAIPKGDRQRERGRVNYRYWLA